MSDRSLPSLPSGTDDVKGPIDTSNWVIPGKLIAGSYPGSILEEKHTQVIRTIVQSGVTHFVCLLDKDEYEDVNQYQSIAKDIALSEYGRTLSFTHFPMIDMRSADDSDVMEFIPKLVQIIRSPDELVYVHCWGGHGRTGIIISLLLVVLYELNADEALRLTELYHSKRVNSCGCHSPQTSVQFEQVRRLGEILGHKKPHSFSLPLLPSDTADVKGPTDVSNWVIPNRLIAGAYPGNVESVKHREVITSIMEAGVSCFVCLMPDYELERFVPYRSIVEEKAKEMKRTVRFVHFPMPDGFTPKDDALMEFIPKLVQIIRSPDELVYVHCWGGHGRTGIIISLLLVVLYELNADEALRLTELYHSKRVDSRNQHSPQTRAQIEQVKRLALEFQKNFTSTCSSDQDDSLDIDVN